MDFCKDKTHPERVAHGLLGLAEELAEYYENPCIDEAGDVLFYTVMLEHLLAHSPSELVVATQSTSQLIKHAKRILLFDRFDVVEIKKALDRVSPLTIVHPYGFAKVIDHNIKKLEERHGKQA